MCAPLVAAAPYIAMAMSAVAAGAEYKSAKDTASSQNKFATEMQTQGEKRARDAYAFNTNQETQKALQETQSRSFELQRIHTERLQKQGEALASSSSSGISLESLQADFDLQEANYRSALAQEADFKSQQSRANMEGYKAQYEDRVASYAYSPSQGPSSVGAVAGLGAKLASSYYSVKRDKND